MTYPEYSKQNIWTKFEFKFLTLPSLLMRLSIDITFTRLKKNNKLVKDFGRFLFIISYVYLQEWFDRIHSHLFLFDNKINVKKQLRLC